MKVRLHTVERPAEPGEEGKIVIEELKLTEADAIEAIIVREQTEGKGRTYDTVAIEVDVKHPTEGMERVEPCFRCGGRGLVPLDWYDPGYTSELPMPMKACEVCGEDA